MRGRTNITQRREPTINGVIKEFPVASGNTIEVGDFVQYKLEVAEENVSVSNGATLFSQKSKISSNKYIYCDNNSLIKLVDCENGYRELYSVSGRSFWVLNNGDLVVVEQDGYSIKRYGIANDEFILYQTINIGTELYGICQISTNEIIAFYTTSGKVGVMIFNFIQNTIVSDYIGYENIYSYPNGSCDLYNVCFAAYNKFGIYGYESSSGIIQDRVFVCFEYSNQTVTSLKRETVPNSNNNTKISILSNINKILFGYRYYSGSSTRNISISFYEILESGISTILNKVNVENNFPSSLIHGSIIMLNENLILVITSSSAKKMDIAILDFDLQSRTFIYSNVIEISTNYYYDYGIGFINSNGDIYILMDIGNSNAYGKYLLKFNYSNGVLSYGNYSGYVEKYNGQKAIGFAKTKGTGGDIIKVYTPE